MNVFICADKLCVLRYPCVCFNACKLLVTELWTVVCLAHSMRHSFNEQIFLQARPQGFYAVPAYDFYFLLVSGIAESMKHCAMACCAEHELSFLHNINATLLLHLNAISSNRKIDIFLFPQISSELLHGTALKKKKEKKNYILTKIDLFQQDRFLHSECICNQCHVEFQLFLKFIAIYHLENIPGHSLCKL